MRNMLSSQRGRKVGAEGCRSLLRVLWTARISNQSILKEISPMISLEGMMMLKLKLQYLGHFRRRADSLKMTLMVGGMGVGGEGDDRG